MKEALFQWIDCIKGHIIDGLDMETAGYLVDSMQRLVSVLCKKKKEGIDVSACKVHLEDLLDFSLKSLAAFATYKLQRKDEPEEVTASKEQCLKIIKMLSELSDEEEAEQDEHLGGFFNKSMDKVFSPFKEMASKARQWFQEEVERQEARDKAEAEWREATRIKDEEEAKLRRERNKKEAEA